MCSLLHYVYVCCVKVDVFSYGIILCEITARVHADPEVLPRTNKFGVDYVAFSKMATDCPLHFLHLTFICCQVIECTACISSTGCSVNCMIVILHIDLLQL